MALKVIVGDCSDEVAEGEEAFQADAWIGIKSADQYFLNYAMFENCLRAPLGVSCNIADRPESFDFGLVCALRVFVEVVKNTHRHELAADVWLICGQEV